MPALSLPAYWPAGGSVVLFKHLMAAGKIRVTRLSDSEEITSRVQRVPRASLRPVMMQHRERERARPFALRAESKRAGFRSQYIGPQNSSLTRFCINIGDISRLAYDRVPSPLYPLFSLSLSLYLPVCLSFFPLVLYYGPFVLASDR